MPDLKPKDVKSLAVCRDCDARIMWMIEDPERVGPLGKKHPVDVKSDHERGNIVLYSNHRGEQFYRRMYAIMLEKMKALGLPDMLYTSHFETCTKRKPWDRHRS